MIDKSSLCKRYFNLLGKEMSLVKSDGGRDTVFAVVNQTWRKNKSRFENNATAAVFYYNDYYTYFGPSDFDIYNIKDNDYLMFDGVKYEFVRRERVIIGGRIQFYTGILKRIADYKSVSVCDKADET